MTAYVVSLQARQDVIEIMTYIARQDIDAAHRLRDRLFAAFDRLARLPEIGHIRNDLAPPGLEVRFWRVGTQLVIYRRRGDEVQIVRVLSAYRDIAALLAE